jgi:peptide/nickel transport system permease protein
MTTQVTGLPRLADEDQVEERISIASQRQLIWWRFRKHRLAVISGVIIILFYLVTLFPEFLATSDPHKSDAKRGFMPPQPIHFFAEGQFNPHVCAVAGGRDPQTFQKVFKRDCDTKIPVKFFTSGFDYKWLNFIPTSLHLIGVGEGYDAEETIFLLGTDLQGRDMWSRLMYATRVSMSIGLVGVGLSLILGIVLGGISGYYGGMVDNAIQRLVEIVRAVPTIPLWMGLAAALPRSWSVLQVYFAITLIISLVAWTDLARVVRGRFLALREEDFVTAAKLAGVSQRRIIFRHMLPSFYSHIIAAVTLAIPVMIISETSLSFLGLGLRPPAISWGTLLQGAQNIQSIALTPWLLIPAVPVIIAILALNFLGDGLRDAADPYST